ncbi:hypothetical protein SDRG_06434 [Saprolegnia diclina VS20]|uniref:B30.2/SPRY domain-containing protein n=1 Tax=Saprolegnia diclina (strain VS20) TaxID=1156394 RepID=T0QEI6_SAPDV|nr:hypothetical protein SDRG_06434 [Saprolegnia diclina VS20]EQC36329.1 hypothetical protein SDRG_06434 [Saprolegnia diclina VS20]|eukprot:XP_008610435.1 hypothetical protein SDRG_06434 [Saprolegnia diclina VS20]
MDHFRICHCTMRLTTVPTDLLGHTLSFLDATDLRAASVASKALASVPTDRHWEALFRSTWNQHNAHVDTSETLELSPALEAAYPRRRDCYRWLTQVVTPVPTCADIAHTNVLANLSSKHRIEPVAFDDATHRRVTAMALGTESVGGDRSIRANTPFPLGPRVQLTKISLRTWRVDVADDAYFEITIQASTTSPIALPTALSMCVAIGLGTKDFRVIGQQPGWDAHSVGYHSDDGRFFTNGQAHPFASSFDVGDTLGCGLLRSAHSSSVFFARNGQRIGSIMRCPHAPLYPVVGLDAAYSITLNCGSSPFQYTPTLQGDVAALAKAPWPQRTTVLARGPPSLWWLALVGLVLLALAVVVVSERRR